ncbi:hypothetical protein Dsin_017713 [Dipteronia sinensis]|uniref:Uncharacterized protein n=1 Tax=Dipteronia sinensis TaxID=43782 RepID=A0AAE0E6Z6_9ROSI|nr:hypothetical protein Dsin_017713 [Dipteronia sinensis]
MEEEKQPKWEGKAMVELASVKAEQVWPCFDEDFCNVHKWFPGFDSCSQLQGQLGQPGLIRYGTTTEPLFPAADDHEKTINWAKEKLLMIDPIQRCLSYEMLDNTYGFKSYVATIKVLPINGDGNIGCKIEWSL